MDMTYVRGRGSNLVSVGWENFTLQVEFRTGQRYQYGGVAQEMKDKLLRSPYPDKLFSQSVRGKYVAKKVSPSPAPKLSLALDLPF